MPVSPGFARLAPFAAILGTLLLAGTLSAQTPQAPAAEKAKPAPLPTPTLLATGRAVDQAGAPIPRARGVVFGASVLAPMSSEFEADVDGRFTLKELPKSAFNLALFPRELGAKAPAPRLLKDRAAWDGAPIQMGTGVAVRALLIDQDGQPVPGTVRFLSIGDVDLPDLAGMREIQARADSEGRVSFNSPAGLHKFVAEGPEHIPVSFERRVAAAAPKAISAENPVLDLGTFTLKRGLTLRGRVENDLGEPLKDVAITTYTNPRSPQIDRFKARSMDGGRFEIAGLVEGNVFLWTKLPGHYLEFMELQAGDQNASIVMARTGAISGRVLDDRGEPVSGASLNFRGSGKLTGRVLGSKKFPTPEFMFDELPPVAAHLQVTLPGFRPKTLENISVASGQTTAVGDITLDRGRTVTGQIVNAKEAGVPGARLTAWLTGTYERSYAAAEPNGDFSFSGLPSGIVEFETTAPGYSPKRHRVEIAAEEDPEPMHIVLESGGRVLGSVLTRRGSPVAGALVQLTSKGEATAWSKSETTNASGGFEIKDLPTSGAQLIVFGASSDGMNMLSSYSSVASREIAIQAGGVTRADFVLREIEVTGRVSGTSPIEALRVYFSNPRGGTIGFGDGRTGGAIPTASGAPRFSATTDASGAYRLVVDEPGRYDVSVISLLPRRTTLLRQKVDVPDLPPDVHEFAADLKITDARLAGIVVDHESGRPIRGAQLQLGTGLTARGILAQSDGRFEAFVPLGSLDIAVTAQGYKPRDLQVTIAEKTADQKIELTRLNPGAETVLAGIARLESGQPAGLAMVEAHPLDGETKSFLTTQADAAGRFSWPDASPGRYAVWARLVGRAGHAIGETGKEPVEINLHPTVAIKYVVVDEAGAEVKGAWLEALNIDGVPFWAVLRSGQGFLPPGRVLLRADSETHTGTATVDVRSAEPMSVTVQSTFKKKN
jgi:hypothetical protein